MRQVAARELAGLYRGDAVASPYPGGRAEGLRRLEAFDVRRYNEAHNQLTQDATSQLSPYIRHGLISLREVRDSVVRRFGARECRSFVMQLLWRVFWYLVLPERRLEAEPPAEGETPPAGHRREGPAARRRVAEEPALPAAGPVPTLPFGGRSESGLYCIDEPLRRLEATGFLPYQARLWVASYLLHWRGVDWREGYRLFQEHLVDADPVVNELSWRWVLGEFTGRPYLFNQARVREYTQGSYCSQCSTYKCPFQGSLEAVAERRRKPPRAGGPLAGGGSR